MASGNLKHLFLLLLCTYILSIAFNHGEIRANETRQTDNNKETIFPNPLEVFPDAGLGWLYINSEQVSYEKNKFDNEKVVSHHWLCEEYLSLSKGISLSIYTRKGAVDRPEESFAILLSSGRIFHLNWTHHNPKQLEEALQGLTGTDSVTHFCQLQHWKDPAIEWPFRYLSPSSGILLPDNLVTLSSSTPRALGLSALWLNSWYESQQQQQQQHDLHCSQMENDEKKLLCSFTRKFPDSNNNKPSYQVELVFNQESGGGLLSGFVTRTIPVQIKSERQLLQELRTEFSILSIGSASTLNQIQILKLDSAQESCAKVLAQSRDTIFPSILNELATSDQQSLQLSYNVRLYYPQVNVIDSFTLSESFSYENKIQIIEKSRQKSRGASIISRERFFRLLPKHRAGKNPSAVSLSSFTFTYWARLVSSLDFVNECTIQDNEKQMNPLEHFASMTPLMHRWISFGYPSTQSGQLLGLSALLMNVADDEGKQLLSEDGTGDYRRIQWLVDDFNGQRVYLSFRKSSPTTYSSSKLTPSHQQGLFPLWVDDLVELEIRKASLDAQGKLSEVLLMSLELLSSSFGSLDQFGQDLSFAIPAICPPEPRGWNREDDKAAELTDSTVENTKSVPELSIKNSGEDELEFPQLSQQLGLARNFGFMSRWTFSGNGLSYLLTERFIHEADELLARVDINPLVAVRDPSVILPESFFLSYQVGAIFRANRETCIQVDQVEQWLHDLGCTSEFKMAIRESDQGKAAGQLEMRYIGLSGLWRLAGSSAYVKFLGTSRGMQDDSEDLKEGSFAQWILEDDPAIANLKVLFNFTLKPVLGNLKRLHWQLESLSIDTSRSKDNFWIESGKVRVDNINPYPHTDPSEFVLPAHCGLAAENFPKPTNLKFPTFESVFGMPPSLAFFELKYSLIVNRKSSSHLISTAESFRSDIGKGRVQMFSGSTKARVWLMSGGRAALELPKGALDDLTGAPKPGPCKRIQSVGDFFNLAEYLKLLRGLEDTNNNETPYHYLNNANFLLANLWHQFGQRIAQPELDLSLQVRTNYVHQHGQGNSNQLIKWRLYDGVHWIEFAFKRMDASNGDLNLHSVVLGSIQVDEKELKFENEIRFFLTSISNAPIYMGKLDVPKSCFDLDSSKNSRLFPTMSKFLLTSLGVERFKNKTNRALHIRSEITGVQVDGAGKTDRTKMDSIILDEWLSMATRAYKMRSVSQSKLDEDNIERIERLAYEETDEYFELSDRMGRCKTSSLKSKLFKEAPKELLLGPAGLWSLAQKENPKAELTFEADDINILDVFTFQQVANQHRLLTWFRSHLWRVQVGNLNFLLRFQNEFQNSLSITGADMNITSSNLGEDGNKTTTWSIHMEVAHFRVLSHEDPLIRKELVIPKGQGCQRGPAFKRFSYPLRDATATELMSLIDFQFSAALYFLGLSSTRSNDVRHRSAPAFHSGWLSRCPFLTDKLRMSPILIRHLKTHFLSGTIASERVYFSEEPPGLYRQPIKRRLDELKGTCEISSASEQVDELLLLPFGQLDQRKTIRISHSLMKTLVSQPIDMELIQRYNTSSGEQEEPYEVFVYEAKKDRIILSPIYKGPGAIIRSYERRFNERNSLDTSYNDQKSLTVEVIIFGMVHLTLKVENIGFKECLPVLLSENSKSEDCAQSVDSILAGENDRIKTFVMSFRPVGYSTIDYHDFLTLKEKLEYLFVRSLIGGSGGHLSPLQIGSKISASLDNKSTQQSIVHLNFKLIEPPSPIEYFEKDSRQVMLEDSELSRLISSAQGCSSWCKSSKCTAFSYCSTTRLCQIVVSNSSQAFGNLATKISETSAESCNTYRSLTGIPLSPLKQVVDYLTEKVNSLNKQDSFALYANIGEQRALLRAYDIKELKDDNFEGDSSLITSASDEDEDQQTAYMAVKLRYRLQHLEQKDVAEGLKVVETNVNSYVDCLESCQVRNCPLFSYCLHDHLCLELSNVTSWSSYKRVLDNSSLSDPNCNIYGQDFLLNFEHFEHTQEPTSNLNYEELFENITLHECAGLCKLEKVYCLSFDYCQGNSANPTSRCYLQKLHVIMSDFDEKLLEQASNSLGLHGKNVCSHHSRSIVADFIRFSNKKFSNHTTVEFAKTSIDTCALICRQNEDCLAFEYCQISLESSCFIKRKGTVDEIAKGEDDSLKMINLKDELESSNSCSVFAQKHLAEQFQLTSKNGDAVKRTLLVVESNSFADQSQLAWQNSMLISNLILILKAICFALLIGILLQLIFIWLTGKEIPLFNFIY